MDMVDSNATLTKTSFFTGSYLLSIISHQVSVFFIWSDWFSLIALESNGVLISEFTPGKWNFLGLEHDKPYLARAQLYAVVNDKQVVNFPMDYPRFESQSKLNMVSICTNMVGQLTTFMLFREQISNP